MEIVFQIFFLAEKERVLHMKRQYSFRLSDETIKKLDKVVDFENDNLERKGILVFEHSRTTVIEFLIDIAFSINKKGQSLQELKLLTGKDEKR